MFRVVVTYGNRRGQTYATVPVLEDAKKLKVAAINLGYRDAFIESFEAEDRTPEKPPVSLEPLNEDCFVEDAEDSGPCPTDPPKVDRPSRVVHDLRKWSSSPKTRASAGVESACCT
jgi:hypothetical protein